MGGREGGREKKQANEKATRAKAHGNAQANLPGVSQEKKHCIALVLTLPKSHLASLNKAVNV